MISIIIVVSWHGHHPSYCAHFIRACASFSEKIYVICPEEANPIEQLGKQSILIEKTSVLVFSNRAAKTGFLQFPDIRADCREIRALVASIMRDNRGKDVFIFHTSLDSLFIGVRQMPLLFFSIRRLFPWPFSGFLLAPDRKWPLSRPRQYLAVALGISAASCKCLKTIHSVLDGALTAAGNLLRSYYLWQKGLVLRRSCCDQIVLLDERYIAKLGRQTGKRVVSLPEITSVEVSDPLPAIVEKISRIRPGLTVVGLLGELSRRKGMDLLLEVLQRLDTEEFLFVIAGPCDLAAFSAQHRAFLKEEIDKRPDVIFFPHRITSESAFNAIIQACDIMYGVYKGHLHSSNLISKAAAFRKPLLVSEGALMAKRVREYGIGSVLREQTATACWAALREMSTPEYRERMARTGRFDDYMAEHSFAKFEATMKELSRPPMRSLDAHRNE